MEARARMFVCVCVIKERDGDRMCVENERGSERSIVWPVLIAIRLGQWFWIWFWFSEALTTKVLYV